MLTRTRTCQGAYRTGNSTSWGTWVNHSAINEIIIEDPVANGNKVYHCKCPPINGENSPHYSMPPTSYGYRYQYENFALNAPSAIPMDVMAQIPYMPLNRAKLPTSSEFGIIQFFAELDDTLAMFSKKFLEELSYGAVSWGVMPFVNDVMNILESIRNLSTDLSSIPYEDELSGNILVEVPAGTSGTAIDGQYTLRFSGTVDISFADDILLLYDRIGFHPDIGTVWDLVPMSFVVDWFLPVSEILDRLYDRGWITSALFSGWKSLKVDCTMGFNSANIGSAPIYPLKFYQRDYLESSLITAYEAPKPIQLKRPSFKQLFNTLYIAKLGKYF